MYYFCCMVKEQHTSRLILHFLALNMQPWIFLQLANVSGIIPGNAGC